MFRDHARQRRSSTSPPRRRRPDCTSGVSPYGCLEVELTIEERDISKVATGPKCKVRTEAYPGSVKVTVPREEEGIYLKPDMTAMVSFLKGP